MTSPPDDTTADTTAVIAALRAERDAALSEKAALAEALDRRNNEFGERIEHQAATIDVLKAMSASPGDPQPIFDLIVERARDLCDAYGATVYEFDGTLIHFRAATDISDDATVREQVAAMYPMAPTRSSGAGRAILDRRINRIDDLEAEPGLHSILRRQTAKSAVALPLLRGDVAIGALTLGSRERGGFSDNQMELLKTFAEQAVIAITSAETYRALQARTSDLQESLDYQTATSDVLKVISRSTFDLQPVLDTVVKTAARLCGAEMAAIARREGDLFRMVAHLGFPPDFVADRQSRGAMTLGRNSVTGRAALEGRVIHVQDAASEPNYPEDAIRVGKQRSSLGVPLLRDHEVVGVIVLARQRVEPFTDRQIELVRTFADQAVIAIENTRLITEQREALEQQTAMAEVLQVINASPGNLTPVFDTVLQRVTRLCDAAFGIANTYDGERFRTAALHRVPAPLAELWLSAAAPPPGPNSPLTRIASGEDIIHIEDFAATPTYRTGEPRHRAMVELGGARSYVAVALRRQDGALLGTLAAYRQEVRPFSDKEIALLTSFAAQAVIAIENARLITETREALEQQTATAEVLQVINASPGNLAPVFDAMLEKAMRLCEAGFGSLYTYAGDRFQSVAQRGVSAAYAAYRERHPPELVGGAGLERAIRTRRAVQITDMMSERAYLDGNPNVRAMVDLGGMRTGVVVPLCKDETALGVISVFRQEVRPFSDRQVALLENFAAQAVIATENARLITEQREALEQQTATAEVLQVINASPGDLVPVFNTMLDNALRLCDANFGQLITFDGVGFRAAAWQGLPPEPNRPGVTTSPAPGMALHRLIHGEEVVHVPDITADEVYRSGNPTRRRLADEFGGRTAIWVALKKDTLLLGAFVIYRTEVRPFSHKQIALLQSFAAQAVIAMENARLSPSSGRRWSSRPRPPKWYR
jgi:GAF domain-containing protein